MKAEGVGQFAARYRAAWKALGTSEADMPLIGLSRHIVVGDTDKEAQSAAKRAFALWYDALIHLWRAHGVGLPRQMIPAEFEPALDGGYIIAGSPATVRERLKRDNDVAGINYCLCRLAFGDLSFEESKRSVELFSQGSDARALSRRVAKRAAVEQLPGHATADLDHVLAVLAPLLEEQRDAGGGALRPQRTEPVGIGRPRPRPALAAGDDPDQSRQTIATRSSAPARARPRRRAPWRRSPAGAARAGRAWTGSRR